MRSHDELAKHSINDLMIEVITSATDIIWGAEEPLSESDWQTLAEAADTALLAAQQTRQGGLLSDGSNWGDAEAWRQWSDELAQASVLARQAIEERDLEDLWQVGDALYQPCEACHKAYHPSFRHNPL